MVKKLEGITSCTECPVGRASGTCEGLPCAFVDRMRLPGESLYLEGEAADRVWFIKSGSVGLFREAGERHGEGIAWTVRGPGALLGLECLVRKNHVDSARALSRVTVCILSAEEALQWLRRRNEAARTALELVIGAGCYDAPRPTSSDGTAVERVARWLIDESPRRNGGRLPRGVVAQLLGMLPETLSRALAELKRRGAIELTRRKITVRDFDALALAAGVDSA